jgi:hypothetical protein
LGFLNLNLGLQSAMVMVGRAVCRGGGGGGERAERREGRG